MKKYIDDPVAASIDIMKESVKKLDGLPVSGVMPQRHQEELKSLAETIKYERFFFVVDIINQTIKHPYGISQWLGYDEDEFSFNRYISIIHPNHVEAVFLLAKSIFDLATSNLIDHGFMKEKYVIDVALRHAKGHYILVKRTLSCWDYDKTNNIATAYLNECNIWGEYDVENSRGIKPRITDIYGTRLLKLEPVVRSNSSKILESKRRFSVQELRVLRKYAYNPSMTAKDVANSFKIKTNTIDTYNRRIISKFNHIYPSEHLKSAKEIAQFLRKEYFI